MKVKRWIALSFASLLTVVLVGQITHQPALDSMPPAIAESAPPIATTALMAQNPNLPAAVLKSGNFQAGEHPTQGKVRIVTQNGKRFLELDQAFKTSSSGPDLVVALHRSPDVLGMTAPPAYPLREGEYVVLAPLQKFNGAQRYALPDAMNLAEFQSAVIWCRQFNATFGAAMLRS